MYQLSEDEHRQIVEYCYERFKSMRADILEKNGVHPSIFLERLYSKVECTYLTSGIIEADNDQLRTLYMLCKNTVDIETMFLDGLCTLEQIDEYDNFFYKNRLLIT